MNTLSRRVAGAPLNRLNAALRSQGRWNGSYTGIWQPSSPNIGTSYNRPVSFLKQKFVNKAKPRTATPTAITHSKANYDADADFNFPDHSIVLEIHSVLYPTTLVVFRAPPKLSETEIQVGAYILLLLLERYVLGWFFINGCRNTTQHNTTQHNTTQHNTTQHNTTQHNTTQMYLQNVYGINTIKEINLQYRRGERWMDIFGRRWKHPDYNRAYVYLAEPVEINLKVNKQ